MIMMTSPTRPFYGLQFTASPHNLQAFSDAYWAGNTTDRRSTTGYCVFLGSNLSWSTKKQCTVARFLTEVEYCSLAHTAAELTWIITLLIDLHILMPNTPILWCDNISAIALASIPVFHAHAKHIEVDFHFVHEKVVNKELEVRHISSMDQTADIFTKSLSSVQLLAGQALDSWSSHELEEGCQENSS